MSASRFGELRNHRPLFLACEAIGWLHMTGKAKADFLRKYGGQPNDYDYRRWYERENPPFPWSDLLQWVKQRYPLSGNAWPASLTEFITKHTERNPGLLGLLQAGHGMASGIEKNIPASTSGYLDQDVTHMWLTTAFGYPVRNLLQDPPEVLTPNGWQRLVGEIKHILEQLQNLGQTNTADAGVWWQWRENAIGPESYLRRAFLSTLAETRLPNNDVTLWDQSYVAAALFKSAVAGAVLVSSFPWDNGQLKQKTRWRVLTVGFGTRHYEARAVKIGDWTGAHREIEAFFEDVRKLIEVDLALGSLVYRDDETLVFTFPGLSEDGKIGLKDDVAEELRQGIEQEIDRLAQHRAFETPPLCRLSGSTRSFVGMVKEIREVRDALAVPVCRSWQVQSDPGQKADSQGLRHVCPVCQVRLNEPKPGDHTDNVRKSRVCGVCEKRRHGRLDAWLQGGGETIWIDEVADENDRVALLMFNLDIEPWLEGERVDSLRAQSIAEWRRFNPVLEGKNNPVDLIAPATSLISYVKSKLSLFDDKDPVFRSLQEGYRHHRDLNPKQPDESDAEYHSRLWRTYFQLIVEDRAKDVHWDEKDFDKNARWLVHQFFRKLPSPGRVYRFWRNAETFFGELLGQFREIVSAHPNRWWVRRLVLEPDNTSGWEDRETYSARWREAPLELLWLRGEGYFITISNLARCLEPHENQTVLQGKPLELFDENGRLHHLTVKRVDEPRGLGVYTPLILLDFNPRRFRALVPLNRATACIEAAITRWQEEFGRVWDRLPLRIGVVAFPRRTSFQAVIEAVRNLETWLDEPSGTECWQVDEVQTRDGVTSLALKRPDGGRECVLVPVRLPDGREDVFYPYVQVEDKALRFPRDFQYPQNGAIYRHVKDLQRGDGVFIWPSRIVAMYLDTTARRFEKPHMWPLAEFRHMREIWQIVQRTVPSITALRGAWSELAEKQVQWRDSGGHWLEDAEEQWCALVRAVLADRCRTKGAALDTLVEAARDGILEWAIEWHLAWLKEREGWS
jgi:hypothetical protein